MTNIKETVVMRVEMDKEILTFGELAAQISLFGGEITAIDVIHSGRKSDIRDITVSLLESEQRETMSNRLGDIDGVRLIHVSDRTFLLHLGGKIEVTPKLPVKNRDDLSHVYTPGVAKISQAIYDNPEKAYSLTIRRNTVAVVSDGTAVLGLGDIGPLAAMPVMEGKAMLFKQLADVDAFPLCLQTKDIDEIVRVVKAVAPSFGGINLEDISSPRCFEIERRLQQELDIPVFHDDQHGTAIVVLAGLLNALKIVNKKLTEIRVVVCGVGAAGIACTNLLLSAGVRNVIGVDKEGILERSITYAQSVWDDYAKRTNPQRRQGGLMEAMEEADVFIGLSGPNVLTVEHLKRMSSDAIVFAMANPIPEIEPKEAKGHVRIFATGRSDYPNQLNNVLAFPGVFRGVLDCRAGHINEAMKLGAARAIASVVTEQELDEYYIVPGVFNERVVQAVRRAVVEQALQTGTARKVPRDFRREGEDGG